MVVAYWLALLLKPIVLTSYATWQLKGVTIHMVELILRVGNEEADALETAMLLNSFSSVLQWCFFVLIIIYKIIKYIKKENAPLRNKTHSQKHQRKGR